MTHSSPTTIQVTLQTAGGLSGPFNQLRAPLIPSGTRIYRLSANGTQGFTVRALAGLVARTGPRIFPSSNSQDDTYFNFACSQYGFTPDSSQTFSTILSMFKSAISQTGSAYNIVPFSAATLDSGTGLAYTAHGACTLAGVFDSLPVESGTLNLVQSVLGSTHVLFDLRNVTWASSPTTSEAFTHDLWLGGGGLPSVAGLVSKDNILMDPNGGDGSNTGPFDYSVMVKSFCFQSMDSADFNTILGSYNPGAYWRGWFNNGVGGLGEGEPQGVSTYSQFQMIGSASNRFGGESFYSGCPIFSSPQTGKRTAGDLGNDPGDGSLSYSTGVVYVLWLVSQGGRDYSAYNEATNVSQIIAARVPVTFLISLDMATIAPPVLHWYWNQQKNAGYPGAFDFIGFNSGGIGYYHPTNVPNGLTGTFNSVYAAQAEPFCNALGVHQLYIAMSGTCANWKTLASDYTDPTALDSFWYALLGNNANGPNFYESLGGSGKPIVTIRGAITIDSNGLNPTNSTIVSQIQSMPGQFVVVVINTPNAGDIGTQISSIMSSLGGNHTAVRADEFVDLIHQYVSVHGSYPPPIALC